MKRLCLIICVCELILSEIGTAVADTWQVVYQTDFSSDPAWISNSPADCYWNSGDGTYHFRMTHGQDQYTYCEVPYVNGASYKLEYDIKLTRCDWAGYSQMVLGGEDMRGMLRNDGPHWSISYHHVDQGHTASLVYRDDAAGWYHPGGDQPAPFGLGVWYHNEGVYEAAAGTLNLTVRRVSDDSVVGTQMLTGVGGFSNLGRLYMSVLGETYAPRATAEGYIDNVVLYAWTPVENEPPIADAGDDIIASANEEITLDGSASYDPDGEIIQYIWKRLPDDVVIYSGDDPNYQTRALGRAEEVIELTVTDNYWATATDTVRIINRNNQDLQDQVAAMQSQIEELQQQIQGLQALVDKIASWRPIMEWLRRAIE